MAGMQNSFVKDKGTASATCELRNIKERSCEIRKDVFARFIGYTKALDKVRHEKIMKILQNLNVVGERFYINCKPMKETKSSNKNRQ